MATAHDLRRFALALDGTRETPHADRAAFRVQRIYVTLSADGKSANLTVSADEQALFTQMYPSVFEAVAGGWGRMGWTTVHLPKVSEPVLLQALRCAWTAALPKPKSRRKTS